MRTILATILAVGLFASDAYAQSGFPNIDLAQTELYSALLHSRAAYLNNGARFSGHLAAAMNHMHAAQAELELAVRTYQ